MKMDTFPIDVYIRNNTTNELRVYRSEGEMSEYDPTEFWSYMWDDGNYGCDCNRALFFYNWGPESGDHPCGDTAFTITKIVRPEDPDKILYSDE